MCKKLFSYWKCDLPSSCRSRDWHLQNASVDPKVNVKVSDVFWTDRSWAFSLEGNVADCYISVWWCNVTWMWQSCRGFFLGHGYTWNIPFCKAQMLDCHAWFLCVYFQGNVTAILARGESTFVVAKPPLIEDAALWSGPESSQDRELSSLFHGLFTEQIKEELVFVVGLLACSSLSFFPVLLPPFDRAAHSMIRLETAGRTPNFSSGRIWMFALVLIGQYCWAVSQQNEFYSLHKPKTCLAIDVLKSLKCTLSAWSSCKVFLKLM